MTSLLERWQAGDLTAIDELVEAELASVYDFLDSMVGDRSLAATLTEQAFVHLARAVPGLAAATPLRGRLFRHARNEAYRSTGHRIGDPWADAADDRSDRRDWHRIATELAGRDQEVLDLRHRHGLDGPDVADAMGLSPENAHVAIHRVLRRVGDDLGALLVSRVAVDDCPALHDLSVAGRTSTRGNIRAHIRSCATCADRREELLAPGGAIALTGRLDPPATLAGRVLAVTRQVAASEP